MIERIKSYFDTLNIFQSSRIDENPYEARTGVITTRVYLVLLILIVFILLLITCFTAETMEIVIYNPTLDQIEQLPSNRVCPCSKISFSHDTFVSMDASLHSVCSSDFITDQWIASLFYEKNASHFLPVDFRSTGFAQFQALSSFCRLSKININRIISSLGSTSFVSSQLVSSPTVLRTQVQQMAARVQLSMLTQIQSEIQLINTQMTHNQGLNGLSTSIIPDRTPAYWQYYNRQIAFRFLNYRSMNRSGDCICTQTQSLKDESCRGPSGIYEGEFDANTIGIDDWRVPTMRIPDFVSSCMPVDACLLSSLECFYNQSCVNALSPYRKLTNGLMKNMTALNSDNASLFSRYNKSTRIKVIVDELMVEKWFIEENYTKYFEQCAPATCNYLAYVYPDLLKVLDTFIGLLGGLCTGLGIIIPLLVRFIRQRLQPPPQVNPRPLASPPASLMIRLRQHIIPAIKQKIAEFNLFEDDTVNDDGETFEIRSQRITTRLYIVLIIVCVTILTFYLSLVPVLRVETVKDPSSGQFIDLQYRFPFSLQCACSSISIPYHIFLTIETQYHQMCSSDLVSETMLYLLGINSLLPRDNNLNYGRSAGSRFRLLDELCTQAQRTVNSSLQRFLEQTMVTAQVISRDLFELQTNSSVDNWKKTTVNSFIRTLDVIRAMEHGNHLAFADINARFDLNVSTYQFLLYSSIYYDGCNCMLLASCHVPMYVYSIWDQSPVFDAMDISNFFHGCSTIEGLFKSTLECFYNQTCMDAVNSLTLLPRYQDFYPVNFTALNATRNLPNETIESVVNRLFVDAWLTSSSFDSYYAVCDPSVCTYEYTTRRDFVYLITKIIGIVGGLTTGLKILLSIALRSATKAMTAGQLSLRAMKTWLSTLIHQRRRLRVQLHFILLVATLSSIASVSISRRVTIKNEILYPSLQNYEQLSTESVSRLQCPCTQASIPNRLFMNLSISGQHQVCSSSFVTEEWLSTLVPSDPISTHSVYDFRKIAIGVFQLLASLCRLSEKYVTDEIFNLMARNYINPYVVPRTQFTKQVQSLIDQFQSMISVEFLATVRLIRKMISDNTLMTVFETNWRWTSFNLVDLDTPIGLELYTEPIVYNGSCSCGLSSHCVQPSSTALGFMIGCYPFEALLKSTMECLYHVSCFSQIQSVTRLFQPLNQSISSRYEKNSTIESILDSLMIEQWASNFSYENYFDSCVPISCSYSYIEHNLSLDVLALLLGLYGGLVIIMNVIAPILTALLRELWVRCRRHQSQIQVVEFDVTVTQHS